MMVSECDGVREDSAEMSAERRGKPTAWLLRLLTWDGVLPAVVWSAPFLIRWLFPNNRGPVELASVILPVAAFVVRFQLGKRSISASNSPVSIRRLKVGALCIGLMLLALIDAVLILTHIMPQGAVFAAARDVVVWVALYAVYLAAMAFSCTQVVDALPATAVPIALKTGSELTRHDCSGAASRCAQRDSPYPDVDWIPAL